MIIIGAKGFAKQLVEVFFQRGETSDIFFFDDLSTDISDTLFGFKIIRDLTVAKNFLKKNPAFALGIGKPKLRRLMAEKFQALGGQLTTVVSPHAYLAHHVTNIGIGSTILTGAVIENHAFLGEGLLVNTLAVIHHDVVINKYCEIGPGAKILGECILGDDVFIGANAVILPKIKIGNGAIIGAGAVVTRDVQERTTVIGSPAKPKI
jgi:sugar O-acyltransferase (sialic acid O-acetyltransferase NeuD family)